MAKQNKMTAGQQAAADGQHGVRFAAFGDRRRRTVCHLRGWLPGILLPRRISNVCCAAYCHGGAWYLGAFWTASGRGSGRSSNKVASSDAVFAFSARLIQIVELRGVDPALRHVPGEIDRLVTVGITDSRFYGSPCRIGRLMLRRLLGEDRLWCGRLSHKHQYHGQRASELASGGAGASGEADLIVATAAVLCFTRCDERAGSQRACASGPMNLKHVGTKITHSS